MRGEGLISVSDSYYRTPPPSNEVEEKLWRMVIELYDLISEETIDAFLQRQNPSKEEEVRSDPAPQEPPQEGTSRLPEKIALCAAPLRHYLEQLSIAYLNLSHPSSSTDPSKAAEGTYPVRHHLSPDGRPLLSASVMEVAIQHPFAPVRRHLTSLILYYTSLWNYDCCAPVAVAAGVGDQRIVMALLAEPAIEPNAGFPLLVAVNRREHEIVRLLLESNRVKPNYGGAFYEAVRTGNRAAVLLFLEQNETPEQRRGSSPSSSSLLDAAATAAAGRTRINVNHFANNEGSTPLTNIIRQTVHLYRREYCNVMEEDGEDEDPIHPKTCYTTLASAMEMIYILLSQPTIDVNKGYYMTPLQMAVREGCLEVVQLLLLHPGLYPNSVSVAADLFKESFTLLRHRTIPENALHGLVLPPLALSLHHRNPSVFSLLIHDERVVISERLQHQLEQDPLKWDYIPYMEALAVLRPREWEGWSWLWRRRCLLWSSLVYIALSVSNLLLWLFFSKDVINGNLFNAFLIMYLVSMAVSIYGYVHQRSSKVQVVPPNVGHHNGNNTHCQDTGLDVFHYLCNHLCASDDNPRSKLSASLVFFCFALPSILPVAELVMLSYNVVVKQKRTPVETEEEKRDLLNFLIGRLNNDWRRKKFFKGDYERQPLDEMKNVRDSPIRSEFSESEETEEEPTMISSPLLTVDNLQQHITTLRREMEVLHPSFPQSPADDDEVNSLSFRIEHSGSPRRHYFTPEISESSVGILRKPEEKRAAPRSPPSEDQDPRLNARTGSPVFGKSVNIRQLLANSIDPNEYDDDDVLELGNESFSRPLPALGAARALRRLRGDTEEDPSLPSPSTTKVRIRSPAPRDTSKKRVHFNLIPETPTSPPRQVYRGGRSEAALLGQTSYHVEDIADKPHLVLRSCYFLLYTAVVLSRLCVSVTCIFIYLLSLFPDVGAAEEGSGEDGGDGGLHINESDSGWGEVGLLAVCTIGLVTSIAAGGLQLVIYLSLRRTERGSLLSGRKNRNPDDEPFRSYLM